MSLTSKMTVGVLTPLQSDPLQFFNGRIVILADETVASSIRITCRLTGWFKDTPQLPEVIGA